MPVKVFAGGDAVTVNAAVPAIPLKVAVIVAEPAATPVASPDALIVAVEALDELHAALPVTFAVDPSLYVAVAVNCSVAPAAMLAVDGETAMAVTVFWVASTVRLAVPLTLLRFALTVAVPGAMPVTIPAALMVATEVLLTDHVAVDETSLLVPSKYVAVAVNCCVAPVVMVGVEGETAIPVMVLAALLDIDAPLPHPAIMMHNKIWGKTHDN